MNSITALATTGLGEVWTLVLNFLIFLVLAGVLFFFANRMGKGPFIALIISLYVGFALFTVFPYAKLLLGSAGALNASIADLVIYAIFTGVAYYLLTRAIGGGFFTLGTLGIIVLSLLTSGFLIALSYHSFALDGIYTFPAVIKMYFAPAQYFFWWFIAPLIGLLAVAR
jgi:hypothetical protein